MLSGQPATESDPDYFEYTLLYACRPFMAVIDIILWCDALLTGGNRYIYETKNPLHLWFDESNNADASDCQTPL